MFCGFRFFSTCISWPPNTGSRSAPNQREQIVSCIFWAKESHCLRRVHVKMLHCGYWSWKVHDRNVLAGSCSAEWLFPCMSSWSDAHGCLYCCTSALTQASLRSVRVGLKIAALGSIIGVQLQNFNLWLNLFFY